MWNVNIGGRMFSLNFSVCKYEEELQQLLYIQRKLRAYGVPSTGNLETDKQLLAKVERGDIKPVVGTVESNTENFTLNTDYKQQEITPEITKMEEDRNGAEQLGILMKLRLGLI